MTTLEQVHGQVHEQVRLRSGLRVVVVDRPGSAAVSVVGAVRAGWRHDGPNRAGTAHLTEHLLTVGADRRARGVEAVGGSFRATTHPDHMEFVTSAPNGVWRVLVTAEIARLHGRYTIGDDVIAEQKEAVREEIRALTASASPWPAMATALYSDEALGHEGFGVDADLANIDDRLCSSFARTLVRPERAALVVAVDVAALGGLSPVMQHVCAPTDSIAPGDHPRRDEIASFPQEDPRTVSGTGHADAWFGWSVPGLARSPRAHLMWSALADVLARRTSCARFGRAGVAHAADRETMALSARDRDELNSILAQPISESETDDARDRLVRAALDLAHDPASIARALLLSGRPDLSRIARESASNAVRVELDDMRGLLLRGTPAVVLPDSGADVDTAARFSSEQTALTTEPIGTRRLRTSAVIGGSVTTRVAAGRAAGIVVDGPTSIHVRTATAMPPGRPGWVSVGDISGHRYAAICEDPDHVDGVVAALPPDVTELATAGSYALHALDAAPALDGTTIGGRCTAVSVADLAARWLALGALNGVQDIALGRAPTVRVVRLPTRPAATTILVDSTCTAGDLSSLIDAWAPDDFDRVRDFVAGQAYRASASTAESSNYLLTLLCNDIELRDNATDAVSDFAATLAGIDDSDIRRAARAVVGMTKVMPRP
ncbi:MAG: insulinase family protein [Rhodococcus sp. (in: high G+C Gram-positive bacteria)]